MFIPPITYKCGKFQNIIRNLGKKYKYRVHHKFVPKMVNTIHFCCIHFISVLGVWYNQCDTTELCHSAYNTRMILWKDLTNKMFLSSYLKNREIHLQLKTVPQLFIVLCVILKGFQNSSEYFSENRTFNDVLKLAQIYAVPNTHYRSI